MGLNLSFPCGTNISIFSSTPLIIPKKLKPFLDLVCHVRLLWWYYCPTSTCVPVYKTHSLQEPSREAEWFSWMKQQAYKHTETCRHRAVAARDNDLPLTSQQGSRSLRMTCSAQTYSCCKDHPHKEASPTKHSNPTATQSHVLMSHTWPSPQRASNTAEKLYCLSTFQQLPNHEGRLWLDISFSGSFFPEPPANLLFVCQVGAKVCWQVLYADPIKKRNLHWKHRLKKAWWQFDLVPFPKIPKGVWVSYQRHY